MFYCTVERITVSRTKHCAALSLRIIQNYDLGCTPAWCSGRYCLFYPFIRDGAQWWIVFPLFGGEAPAVLWSAVFAIGTLPPFSLPLCPITHMHPQTLNYAKRVLEERVGGERWRVRCCVRNRVLSEHVYPSILMKSGFLVSGCVYINTIPDLLHLP